MQVAEFWLKCARDLAAIDYRAYKLIIGKDRVNQLTVVGVAAEVVWKLAFHERRGLTNVLRRESFTMIVASASRTLSKNGF